jgi:hypothetical protein
MVLLFTASASARKGPHLVVTSVKAAPGEQAPLHRFWGGDRDRFHLIATVKNTGKAASKGGAGELQTASGDRPGVFVGEDNFDLPRLKPGERQNFQLEALGFDGDINAYTPRVCVPVKGGSVGRSGPESCRKGPRFGVIPQKWTASITSKDEYKDFTETASYNYTFAYDAGKSKQVAAFVYKVTGGDAHLSVSGTDAAGCSHSGTFDTTLDRLSTMAIGLRVDKYAVSAHPKVATFETTVACPGNPPESHPQENEFNGPWSSVGVKVDDHRTTAWSGSQEGPFDKFSWLLEAK